MARQQWSDWELPKAPAHKPTDEKGFNRAKRARKARTAAIVDAIITGLQGADVVSVYLSDFPDELDNIITSEKRPGEDAGIAIRVSEEPYEQFDPIEGVSLIAMQIRSGHEPESPYADTQLYAQRGRIPDELKAEIIGGAMCLFVQQAGENKLNA